MTQHQRWRTTCAAAAAAATLVAVGCGAPASTEDTSETVQRIDPIVRQIVRREWVNTRSETYARCTDDDCPGMGHIAGFWCDEFDHCHLDIYLAPRPGDDAGWQRPVSAAFVRATRTGSCPTDPQVTGVLDIDVRDDGAGGANYPYSYNYAFDCAARTLTLTPDHQDHAVASDVLAATAGDACEARPGETPSTYQDCCAPLRLTDGACWLPP